MENNEELCYFFSNELVWNTSLEETSHCIDELLVLLYDGNFTLYYHYLLYNPLNTLMIFWHILGQRKNSLVVFLWKRKTSLIVFLATILFLMALFFKKTTKLVFIWSNMGQKSIKVLNVTVII